MSAELLARDAAYGRIPSDEADAALRGSFTRRRIERILALTAGVGSAVLGLQTLLIALGSDSGEQPGWKTPLLVAVFLPLAIMCIACLIGRGVAVTAGAFAVIYVVCLVIWPIATAGSTPEATPEPWIWYLINVATVAAVLAFPVPLQVAWTVATPLLFGLVRLVQGEFAPAFWIALSFDVSFALMLGGLLLVLGWMYRRAATGVDAARARAAEAYERAAEADAAQQERVAVSGLMHDSVLAALISAERADTPRARALAVSMAREALEGLADMGAPRAMADLEERTLADVRRRLIRAAREQEISVHVALDAEEGAPAIPGDVASAFVGAAVQAVANSVEHAGGRGMAVGIGRPAEASAETPAIRIRVTDAGSGFDLDAVPEDRLGIKASIVARAASVGGRAIIDSGPHGTLITLVWVGGE